MLDDIVSLSTEVKLVSYSENYRALHVITGIIINLNASSALILTILKQKQYFKDILLKLNNLLPNEEIDQTVIQNFLIDLYCKGFINIEKNPSKPTVLLINPNTTNSKYNYRKENASPPLGLVLIGTVLADNDYNVRIIDMDIENLIQDDILYRIRDIKFDYVGISMNFSMCANISLNIAKQIKDKYKNIPVIVGGNHATFTSEDLLLEKCIDFVIRYNGHDTFNDLIKILERKNYNVADLLECKGIAFRNEGKILSTANRDNMYDLDKIPLFDWNLIPLHLYSENQRWNLFTSVGCTNSCHFCSTSAFNGRCRIRQMSYPRIMEHINNIYKYENKDYINLIFLDDAFTADKQRIIGLCSEIIDYRLKIKWACNARADQVDEELLRFMKKANCSSIFFGVESCDKDVLLSTNKKLKVDLNQKFLEVKSHGIAITLSFIIGLPKETKNSLSKIEELIKSVRPYNAKFSFLVLYPGTEYYINKEKYGIRQLITDWDKYERYMPYIETEALSAEDQMEALIRLTESFYS